MIIDLGHINVNSVGTIQQIRKKLLVAGSRLSADPILPTRLASIVSQTCKTYLNQADHLVLGMQLTDQDSGYLTLLLTFSSRNHLPTFSALTNFFDNIEKRRANEGYEVIGQLALPASGGSFELLGEEIRRILQEKSRDELMEEIKAKNEELNESLENLRTTRSAKERMESELNIGRDIQMSMLPLDFPPFPHRHEFDIYALLHPAREVGGDFYDFFFIDENHFCFCVGDVSGKGVPASLFMAVTKTMIKSKAADDYSTASIITQVNDELSKDNKSSMFVTLFICILNVHTGKMVFTNAGHNPPYIIREAGKDPERLATLHGPVLGAIEEMAYKEGTTILNTDDYVLLYTDGVTEAMNLANELYSEQRLVNFIQRISVTGPDPLTESILEEIKTFENGADQADDITLLTLRYKGARQEAQTLEILLENRMEEISRFIQTFTAFAKEHQVENSVIQKFCLSADDMLNNIISYSYTDEATHEIKVEAVIYSNRMVMVISDDGRPFNPFGLNPPDTTLPLEERQIGGLGIHLVQNLMDETDYQRRAGYNVVTLSKYLNGESPV
ncbi:MAG: serine/threonine protein phosphatase [Bacteroidetes bacterium]|nr:MAG: serine/threonine protein phosphatase [Bacteroidota bacterium]